VDNAVPATAFKNIVAPRRPGEREENETERGLRVADKGFLNTAVISSQITYIDGEAGSQYISFFFVLLPKSMCSSAIQVCNKCIARGVAENRRLLRGYPIEQLALHSSFLESAYLLIYGSLPTKNQYRTFEGEVMHHSVAHIDAEELFRSFRCVWRPY